MSKKDEDWYVPWVAVVICAIIFGAIGRYIALRVAEDNATANLTFVIVAGGAIFIYILFIAVWEIIRQVIFKKKPLEEEKAAEEKEQKATGQEPPKNTEDTQKAGELPAKSLLQRKIKAFCKYTDNILAGPVAVEDLLLLHKYIEQYARKNLSDIPHRIKTHTVDTFDLCHYGWNIWNHFDSAQQLETAEWLIKVFEQLKDISPNTIHKKFTHKERMTYIIPLEDNIK